MISTTIFQIVTGDSGDDDMLQFHAARRLGHTRRFIGLKRRQFAVNGTQTTERVQRSPAIMR